MFAWFWKLFGRPKQIEVKVIQDRLALPPSPLSDLQQTFVEVFRNANEERIRQEQEFLNDEKLKGYFTKAFKYMARQLPMTSGDDILFNHEHIGVNAGNWNVFVHIFCGVCKELDVGARQPNDSYIFVNKKSLLKAIDTLHQSEIDVDERIRAMLHSGGPYR